MKYTKLLIKIITSDGNEYDFNKKDFFFGHADACKDIAKLNLTNEEPTMFVYNYLSSISKNGHIAFMRDSYETYKFGLIFLPDELNLKQYEKLKELLLNLKDYNLEIALFNKENESIILGSSLKFGEQNFDTLEHCKIKKC